MELLLEHDVLEECEQIDDLCLTDEFKHQWQNAIKNSDDETLAHYASSLLNADPSDVTLKTDGGEANRPVFNIDGTVRGNWMSQAAMQADLTAAAALADRLSLWQDLQPNGRAEIIATLRPFLEECPACGGQITMDQETVESCCREFETIIINCQACGDELLNERLND